MLNKKLRELRILNKLTQGEIAEKIDVALTTYANWEQGTRKPNNKILVKLANIFGCTTDYLLGNEGLTHKVGVKNIDDIYEEDLKRKIRELAKILNVTEIGAIESIKAEGYDLKDLYEALKLIKSVQGKKSE